MNYGLPYVPSDPVPSGSNYVDVWDFWYSNCLLNSIVLARNFGGEQTKNLLPPSPIPTRAGLRREKFAPRRTHIGASAPGAVFVMQR
jgi:hypothetical protein